MRQLVVDYDNILTLNTRIETVITMQVERDQSVGLVCSDFRSQISSVASGKGHLSSAIAELYSRQQLAEQRADALGAFKDEVNQFADNAVEADYRVATRISDDNRSFCYTNGLNPVNGFLGDLWNKAKAAWEYIAPLLDVIIDVGLAVLAVSAFIAMLPASGVFAFLTVCAAGFFAAKAIGDAVTSAVSFGYWVAGDRAQSDLWAERGLRDGFLWAGRQFDKGLGTTFFESAFGGLYTGCEIFSAVVGVVNFGKDIFNAGKAFIKDFKLTDKWKNIFTGNWGKGWSTPRWLKTMGSHFTNPQNWKAFGGSFKKIFLDNFSTVPKIVFNSLDFVRNAFLSPGLREPISSTAGGGAAKFWEDITQWVALENRKGIRAGA